MCGMKYEAKLITKSKPTHFLSAGAESKSGVRRRLPRGQWVRRFQPARVSSKKISEYFKESCSVINPICWKGIGWSVPMCSVNGCSREPGDPSSQASARQTARTEFVGQMRFRLRGCSYEKQVEDSTENTATSKGNSDV